MLATQLVTTTKPSTEPRAIRKSTREFLRGFPLCSTTMIALHHGRLRENTSCVLRLRMPAEKYLKTNTVDTHAYSSSAKLIKTCLRSMHTSIALRGSTLGTAFQSTAHLFSPFLSVGREYPGAIPGFHYYVGIRTSATLQQYSSCNFSEDGSAANTKPPLSYSSWRHRGSARPNKTLKGLHKLALYDRVQHCWCANSSCARTFHALTITLTEMGIYERPTAAPSNGICCRLAVYTRPTIIGGVSPKHKIIFG